MASRYLKLFITLILFVSAYSWCNEIYTTKATIEEFYTDDVINDHTCQRVKELGNSTVSEQECRAALSRVNEKCAELALSYFGEVPNSPEQAGELAKTLMLCPIALQLNQEAYITDEGVRYRLLKK